MNTLTYSIILFFALFISVNTIAQNKQFIACNDKNIIVEGSNYISVANNELITHRHNNAVYKNTTKQNLFNPLKARTGAGITLSFKTKSPTVVAKFKIIEGLKKAPVFGIFQDDEFYKNERFKYVTNAIIRVNITSKKRDKTVTYTITYPLKTDVHFVGLELLNDHVLEPLIEKNKKRYVAFGDSITHGTGQQTTQETYPYILARKLDYELFNTAVGGSKTSAVMAEMICDDFNDIDMMTILIGYNDYNGEGVDINTYRARYETVLNTIRAKHKATKIYCISLLTTKMMQSKTSNLPIEPFVNVVKKLVLERQKKGDKNIIFIQGDRLVTLNDLKDNVHLSIEGAKLFAEQLSKIIK